MNTNTNKPKTRICENIKKNGTCVYGKNCHFAHDIKELTISKCAFGQRCVFVQYSESMICNSQGSKICKFLHPTETVENLFVRLEMNHETPPPIKHMTPVLPKKPDCPLVFEANITPIRLDFQYETMKQPDQWVTVRSKKNVVEVVTKVETKPLVERETKMVATVDAKNLLNSVEKWMDNGLTELFITIK